MNIYSSTCDWPISREEDVRSAVRRVKKAKYHHTVYYKSCSSIVPVAATTDRALVPVGVVRGGGRLVGNKGGSFEVSIGCSFR